MQRSPPNDLLKRPPETLILTRPRVGALTVNLVRYESRGLKKQQLLAILPFYSPCNYESRIQAVKAVKVLGHP